MEFSRSVLRVMQSLGILPRVILLMCCDFLTLFLCTLVALCLRALGGGLDITSYGWMLSLLLLAPVMGLALGLYGGISLPAYVESRKLCVLTSLTFGLILVLLFAGKASVAYSRLALVGAWGLSLFVLPVTRRFCRHYFGRFRWWGTPLVILDRSNTGRELWHYLKRHPWLGLAPVDIFTLSPDLEEAGRQLREAEQHHPGAIALMLQPADGESARYVHEASRYFVKILVVPAQSSGVRQHWFHACDLGTMTGFMLMQNLRRRWRQRLKRSLDLALCLPVVLVFAVPGLLLALLIRLDSPGPVFYRQRRLGMGGKAFDVFKFRTMRQDADAVLASYLEDNPDLREEWEKDRKLRHDPRITRIGRFLRKSSLDELPQLLNVLRGEMSLVGPRPIVESEIVRYGDVYADYCRVRPGITGLWQVSGRNNTTYEERVNLDRYYVTNWCIWMDLWILARTFPVVITGYGAY
ncbi:undecaprenyl-phosphate galactose phosphotransferase WbaP [uncultured Desulfovibrio sp.]|uniref:undecaprenyl-phosphate galactose phosphotransferase WbaP n=1 Tax=uncultured Desulfovibrio sp. TaxID=167968 RepID=UPI00262BE886|nr:undecaprenyl-phosphate galactose phosphotransferase WbaP [uncultured Desulfovibrio sp.]